VSVEFVIAMICNDCILYVANGDTSGLDTEEDRERVICPDNPARFIADCRGDDDCDAFSKASCDRCGTHLAGARHRSLVEVIDQTPPPTPHRKKENT
jgi:hypothetical protein